MSGWLKKRVRAWLSDGEPAAPPPEAAPRRQERGRSRRGQRLDEWLTRSRQGTRPRDKKAAPANPFMVSSALHPKGVAPDPKLAMDDASGFNEGINAWAFNSIQAILQDGQTFLGYPLLAELAQRPEYRRISETIARHAVRKWIIFNVKGDADGQEDDEADEGGEDEADAAVSSDLAPPGVDPQGEADEPDPVGEGEADDEPAKKLGPDPEKLARIAKIEEVLERIGAKAAFERASQQDGFFGRSHIYVDTGSTDEPEELKTSIGDGSADDPNTELKCKGKKGFIKKLKTVEAVWCYPTDYNSNNPLRDDWYKPNSWFVMGSQVHRTRLLTFVGREVPDILKPAYSFGGLSMSQMVKPYVDNWLSTRQAVADLIRSFSVFVLKTNLVDALEEDPDGFFKRLEIFNNLRDNSGVFAVDKNVEDFANVSATISGLDKLQAQAQEQMASVAAIPIVLLLMITPSGLNASSEGEIQAFWDWVHSYAESFIRPHLTTVINLIQWTEFGDVDPDIVWEFDKLEGLNDLEWSQKQLADAQRDVAYTEAGIVDPIEVRKELATRPNSPYRGIDIDDVPEPPEPELPPGFMPGGGEPGEPPQAGAQGKPAEVKKPVPAASKTKVPA